MGDDLYGFTIFYGLLKKLFFLLCAANSKKVSFIEICVLKWQRKRLSIVWVKLRLSGAFQWHTFFRLLNWNSINDNLWKLTWMSLIWRFFKCHRALIRFSRLMKWFFGYVRNYGTLKLRIEGYKTILNSKQSEANRLKSHLSESQTRANSISKITPVYRLHSTANSKKNSNDFSLCLAPFQ